MGLRQLQRGAFFALVVLAFIVQPWTASRGAFVMAAGPACCCPDPATCPCHDHGDRAPGGDAQLRKCGQNGVLVTPIVIVAVADVPRPVLPLAPRATAAALARDELPREDLPTRPVTPPF
ncbi:MAG: hypothetical protein H6709_17530 [Kofleriaceae bacterium]|nr:hypothetical protein [Myxococcales bacterium]MCB9573885.1 hypothetical protein [Kofleriaceae bacterium]